MLRKPNEPEHGTAEWWRARNGVLTGSRAYDIERRSRSYLRELIHVRATGERLYEFDGPAVRWGRDQEAAAIAHYEIVNDTDVSPGFLMADDSRFDPEELILYWRGTPDGFVGKNGGIEVKCPFNPVRHIEVVHNESIPGKHWAQMQAYMGMSGREWWDYVSFDPRQSVPEYRYFQKRIYYNPSYYESLLTAVDEMWEIVKSGDLPDSGPTLSDSIPELF